jgi:hypothetical protein
MTTQNERRAPRARFVIGPDGAPLTLENLPKKDTKRWITRRKAEVVCAVRGGLITLEQACDMYRLSVDEYLSWQRDLSKYGLQGLKATRVKENRR